VLAAVARRHDDFAAAEDAVQEAVIAAAARWPADGVPANPRGWLYAVALRRLADERRSGAARRRREAALVDASDPSAATDAPSAERDDSLALLVLCCHPALTPPSAIALTLRAVGGLTTAEIARAFLVPEATMAQRISRAKQAIKAAGARFRPPAPDARAEWEARLGQVRRVLYLMYTEGYAASGGPDLVRPDVSGEAIRLARLLHALAPDDGEAAGLLALMLLTDARRAARVGPRGELVPLDEQDRSRWDQVMIAEGVALVSAALPRGRVGPYQLQAAVAALHDEAPRAEETDWPQILALYAVLRRLEPDNPMVALNEAVAAAMVHGPAAALARLAALDADPRVAGHYRLDAVRGHLHERAGDLPRAAAHYRAAAGRTPSAPERDYLALRALRAEPRAGGGSGR
jgi:RNA polymerase sigma factor (sigma-70 family)